MEKSGGGGKFAQIVEGVEAGVVAVAEFETDGVVADDVPADHLHAVEFLRAVAAVLVAKNVALAGGFRARRRGAQALERKVTLDAVVPNDGDLLTDELDVGGRVHGAGG